MAKSWRDFSAGRESADPCDIRDNRDISPSDGPLSAPNVTNVTNVNKLPADVRGGLDRLREMAVPRLRQPERWPTAVADAFRLAAEGWAAQALALGWSTLDLFGAVPDANGDPDAEGLAVKLNGRRLLAICASFATVADANGGRSYLYRGNNERARLLWELGRGR